MRVYPWPRRLGNPHLLTTAADGEPSGSRLTFWSVQVAAAERTTAHRLSGLGLPPDSGGVRPFDALLEGHQADELASARPALVVDAMEDGAGHRPTAAGACNHVHL